MGPAALCPAEQAVDSYCTGPHARISHQKAAAYHLQCLLLCCCSLRLASHEEMPCMGQRGRCSVLFPRDRSWFIYTLSNSFDQIILSPATILYNTTPSIPNYRSFDFFNPKFDHSSYLKICAKHHFFVVACFINTSFEEWFKFDYVCINFLNETSGQTWYQKSQTTYNLERREY